MSIALTIKKYLEDHDVTFDVVTHKATGSSSDTAHASHVSGDCLAKGVVIKRTRDICWWWCPPPVM